MSQTTKLRENQAESNNISEGSVKDESKKAWSSDLIETLMNNYMSEINKPITKEGKTLLMDAVWKKDIERVKTLIALGADIHKLNVHEQTAYDSANFVLANSDDDERERLEAIRSLLEKVGGKTGHELIAEIAERDKDMRSERRLSTKLAGDRVLCLDNSSTMALVQLELLSQIETLTKKKITELFQWIVASGIGGVLMLVMVYGGKSIEELRHFYYRLYYQVFNNPQAKDKGKELERMVIDELGDAATHGNAVYMQKVKKPKLLIGAVNKRTSMLDLKFFSNCPTIQEDDMHVWKVARCTCSSPLFFGEYDNFIDTGVICKNPCGVGLERMEPYFTPLGRTLADSITMVVSLGDGIPPADVLGDAGELPNFVRLFNSAANYQSEHISSALCCRWCESRDISFFRFNPLLKESIPVPEGASVEALINVAIQTIAHIATGEGKEIIEKMQKEL